MKINNNNFTFTFSLIPHKIYKLLPTLCSKPFSILLNLQISVLKGSRLLQSAIDEVSLTFRQGLQ